MTCYVEYDVEHGIVNYIKGVVPESLNIGMARSYLKSHKRWITDPFNKDQVLLAFEKVGIHIILKGNKTKKHSFTVRRIQ